MRAAARLAAMVVSLGLLLISDTPVAAAAAGDRFEVALDEGRIAATNADQPTDPRLRGVEVFDGWLEEKDPPTVPEWVDPVSAEVRAALASGATLTEGELWLRIVPVGTPPGCELEGPAFSPSLLSELFPRDDHRVETSINEIGAIVLAAESLDSVRSLVEAIDEQRPPSLHGRAVYDDSESGSWEIASLELGSEIRGALSLTGFETTWSCLPNNGDDIADGRGLIRSDPLKRGIKPLIRIGLLDSGVDTQIPDLNSVVAFDCLQGSAPGNKRAFCSGSSPIDSNDESHGTKSASILAGRGPGESYSGVTAMPLVSFKIGEEIHQSEAVQRAVEVIKQAGDKTRVAVVLAQLQAIGSSRGVMAALADSAFEQGLVIVSPIGNTGTGKRLTSPGNAHKVIGVGAVELADPDRLAVGTHGPTRDGRIKPDLLGPTHSEALVRGSGKCGFHIQTSGAAPYVAGGVALLKNLVVSAFPTKQFPEADHPGLIYPLALLSGQEPYDRCRSRLRGAGLMRLPEAGKLFFGEIEIAEGESIWIPISEVDKGSVVDAAIWWPEEATQDHSDLDLSLRGSCGGREGFPSDSYGSVFERARAFAETDGCSGEPWYVEISAYDISERCPTHGRQRVYWAAFVADRVHVEGPLGEPPPGPRAGRGGPAMLPNGLTAAPAVEWLR